MTREERQVLSYIVGVESAPHYDPSQGVKVSVQMGKPMGALGYLRTQRYGRTALRVWSTEEGREALKGPKR